MMNFIAALVFIIGLVVEEYFAGAILAIVIYLVDSNRRLKKRVSLLELDAQAQQPGPIKGELTSTYEPVSVDDQSANSDGYQPDQIIVASSLNANPEQLTKIARPNEHLAQAAAPDPTLTVNNLASNQVRSIVDGAVGPLASIFDPFLNIYHHYRAQGKTPVFLLTLAGVTTLIMGFGYLLQYSFTEHLSPAGKVSVTYLFAFAVMVLGIIVYKKRPNMTEFAASLIGLSLVLLYLCTYFLGPYHQLTSDTLTFVILAGITAAGYVLAILFETRIVAFIGLIGGATAPALVTGAAVATPLLYLAYLCLICAAALALAFAVRWQLLAQLSLVTSIAFVEYTLENTALELTEPYFFLALVHAFFYLLCSNVYLQWSQFSASRPGILLQLSGSLLFMLVALEQVADSSAQYGVLLLVNAGITIAIFLVSKFKSYPHSLDVSVFSLLSSGVFAGVALLVLTTPELLSLIWGFEGLILLYLGLRFGYPIVRTEAMLLLVTAAITALFNVLIWFTGSIQPLPILITLEFNDGYLNLVALFAILVAIPKLLTQYLTSLTPSENRIMAASLQLSYALLSVVLMLSLAGVWPKAFWLFAIIPLFSLTYVSAKNRWGYLEKFALSLYFLLLVPVLASGLYLGNFHFREQTWIAQFARIEAFVALWAIAYFYRRFIKLSPLWQSIQKLETLFYLILPIFFLPAVFRQTPEFLALALWGSATISVLIYYKLPRPALSNMAKLLVYSAAFASLLACYLTEFANWQGHAVSPLLLGVALSLLLFHKIKAFSIQPEVSQSLQPFKIKIISLFTPAIIYWGLSVMTLVYGMAGDLTYALISAVSYCIGLILLPQLRVELKQHYGRIICCIWILSLCSALSIWTALGAWDTLSGSTAIISNHQLNLVYMISVSLPLIAATLFVAYSDMRMFVLARRLIKSKRLSIVLSHACLTSVYLSVIYFWQASLMGPLVSIMLVIHGTNLLFHTLKTKYQWLMPITIGYFVVAAAKVVMWDISDLSIIQKTLAFMLIGSILLVAAYQYQKLKASNQH